MKELLFTLALLAASTMSFAQTVSDIFKNFKDKEHVQYINVPKAMIETGMSHVKKNDVQSMFKNIESAQILNLEDCSKKIKNELVDNVKQLNRSEYQEIMRANDDDDKMLILAKMNGDDINELLILHSDDEDCTFIQVNGLIKRDDIDKIVSISERKKQ
jgi:hypothetical protein